MDTYLTVAIPYVNARPHIGYAFELIDADLAARARRALGHRVRFLGVTDDHSLKNVLAAEAAGEATRPFVDRHAERFAALGEPLDITFDDFIRTSRDPRHEPGVTRLWRACAAAGDLYRRDYRGRYCVGCERFYADDELVDGRCPDHDTPVEEIGETNWFFRLSRYGDRLHDSISSGALTIAPDHHRREVLAFIERGLDDISVSRSTDRARGWGIPVPDDPTQTISVWFDALVNYVSALGYGEDDPDYDRWWRRSSDRIHVVGKGITRFHAVYWPAFLLSAGEPLPTRIQVHPYLTADGAKVSKSAGGGLDPIELVDDVGIDALRWWIAHDVSTTSDTDASRRRVAERSDLDLANGIGNAVGRVLALRARRHEQLGPLADGTSRCPNLPADVGRLLAGFERRRAAGRIADEIGALNRYIEETAPWLLIRDDERLDEAAQVLGTAIATLRSITDAIAPITPGLAGRVHDAIDADPSERTAPLVTRLGTEPV